jgi:5-methylcytosine-specific restriction endonuclease McrA
MKPHVDHIVPIKAVNPETGEHIASGLHVPWNLQYLTKGANLSKQNKLVVA